MATRNVRVQEIREYSTAPVDFEEIEWLIKHHQKQYGIPTASNLDDGTVLYVFKSGSTTINVWLEPDEAESQN